MKILGIDPGSRNLGYCVLEYHGKGYQLIEAGVLKIKSTLLQEQIVELIRGLVFFFLLF